MNDGPGTILILTPGFPKDESDTTCLPFLQVLMRSLKREYPAQKIIVLSFQYPYQKSDYCWHGINVISMGGRNKGGINRLLLWTKIRRRLKRLALENNITGVMSIWCGETALIAKKFAGKYSIPWFCWIPGQDAKKGNHYVKRINPLANSLVALSDFIADEFERNHGIRPAHYLLPGIENPQPNKPLPEKDIDIIGAGSLIPLKQYALFIEIISEIKNTFEEVKAVIAGEGPERKKLEEMIKEMGLDDNITLTGEIPHQQVLTLMERSRLFLHTSNYEGFGVVCIEALYAGCRVISFTQPMKKAIPNWQIVSDKQEMMGKAISVLKSTDNPERVIFNDAGTMAKEFAALLKI
jgi:glycosyltransferase involved in cell wall biosynthesis